MASSPPPSASMCVLVLDEHAHTSMPWHARAHTHTDTQSHTHTHTHTHTPRCVLADVLMGWMRIGLAAMTAALVLSAIDMVGQAAHIDALSQLAGVPQRLAASLALQVQTLIPKP